MIKERYMVTGKTDDGKTLVGNIMYWNDKCAIVPHDDITEPNILEMLVVLETVRPVRVKPINSRCPNCDIPVINGYNFCTSCGMAIDWD